MREKRGGRKVSKTKHTPGPWWNESGTIHAKNPLVWTGDNHSCVHPAYVNDVYWESENPTQEYEANAALIAAAPDLYAALEGLVARLEFVPEHSIDLSQADAALAKARGEQKEAEGE